MKASQTKEIQTHLESGKSITQMDALNLFGCFRLAARIHDLRKQGLDVVMELVETSKGKSVASYSLAQ